MLKTQHPHSPISTPRFQSPVGEKEISPNLRLNARIRTFARNDERREYEKMGIRLVASHFVVKMEKVAKRANGKSFRFFCERKISSKKAPFIPSGYQELNLDKKSQVSIALLRIW